jgi:hypothetical protein
VKVYRYIIITTIMLVGCETAHHPNGVHHNADITYEDSQSCIEDNPPYEWDALICTEYGEKDLAGNGTETGYCCVWLEDPPMCETPPCSIPMLCQHNLCFWESSCSWELISTTCDQ